uniref:hypothetical protein n=1 Tax=Klebsiella pneumoniae TaxID=573 RepID=UPI00163DA0B4
ERTGYSNSFVYSKEKLATNHTYSVANQYNIAPISKKEKAYAYYRSFFSKQNLCIQKNEEDFNAIITFYEIEKGEIISAEINNQIKGLCFINELDN